MLNRGQSRQCVHYFAVDRFLSRKNLLVMMAIYTDGLERCLIRQIQWLVEFGGHFYMFVEQKEVRNFVAEDTFGLPFFSLSNI